MADLLKFVTDTAKDVQMHGGKCIDARGDLGFNIHFPYDPALIDVVKLTLPRKATWDQGNKVWWVAEDPLSVESIGILREKHGFVVLPLAEERLQHALKREVVHGVTLREPLRPLKTPVERPLLDYQKAGVQFALENKRVLICDGVGLGKSTECIVAVEEAKAYPCIITCISITKPQWKKEIETVLGTRRKVVMLSGTRAQPIPTDADFIILNDDILHAWTGQLLALNPKSVIPDEAHRFKDHKRRRSRALRNLVQVAPYLMLPTATPMVNGLVTELAALLILAGRINDVGGWHRLVDRYGVWERGPWGSKCVGTRDGVELNALLIQQGIMCRRTKDMVGGEMLPLTKTVLETDITNRSEYRQAEADIRAWIKQRIAERKKEQRHLEAADRAEMLVRMSTLRRICGLGKIEAVAQWAEEVLEQGEPMLIFAHHKEVAHALQVELSKKWPASVLDGDTPEKQRQDLVRRFGTELRVLVATIDAAGTGLDGLQKHASIMALVELPWTPGRLEQAIGRLDRTGQTRPVSVYIFLAKDTLDATDVYPTIQHKQATINAVVDGQAPEADENLTTRLLKKFGGA